MTMDYDSIGLVDELELTSLEQVVEGFNWNWSRLSREREWEEWYEGDFDSLFSGTATDDNGMRVFDPNQVVHLGLFRAIAEFYWAALMSERPSVTSEDEARQNWLDEYLEKIWIGLDKAVEWWTYKGRAVIMVTEQMDVIPVDPSFYFPIRAEYDQEQVVAHLLAYTWHRQESDTFLKNAVHPNRIRLVKLDPEIDDGGTVEHRLFHGQTIGELQETENAELLGIFTAGNGSSMFSRMRDPMRALMVRYSALTRTLNRHSNPHLVSTQELIDEAGNPRKLNPNGDLIIAPNEDGSGMPVYYLTWDGMIEPSLEYIAKMEQYVHLTTGAPPVVFGIDVGKGESGASRDRLLFSAQSRVARMRREIEAMLEGIIDAMGAPGSGLDVGWVADPFASLSERRESLVTLVQAGIVSKNEARSNLGYDPLEETEMAEMEQQSNPQTEEGDGNGNNIG